MDKSKLITDIKKLATKKNALILAHNYQNDDVQDIADVTGDSLELARIANKNDAEIIVFCGVHFMAESAAILSPEKLVLLPEITSGCPMADMATKDEILKMKALHPNAKVVTYINSSADVKSVSDVICTSSNAQKIVDRIDANEIIFVPDKNLGSYVKNNSKKKIILWEGFCPTHENFSKDDLLKVKQENPKALVMVHPECNSDVIKLADRVFSTGQMVQFVKETDAKEIIVGTEIGMIHKLKSVANHIKYIEPSKSFICPNMKKNTLEKVYLALKNEKPAITVDSDIAIKAKKALDKMLELSY